ncbi:YitT family protein [Wansuia hejianensis]|uniref:YitT family protein n=1 Tax=Wansuia hejianensis TaxID=2763667 RepID=A0A926ILK9_9FIRM|nr:YitT family protein [Wansuia hejianensis]MBC8590249.1 YitT family protein [Wansuia hejianensis]
MEKKFDIKSFLIINLGVIILALGLHIFLIPADLAAGGVTGIALVLNYIVPKIPVGIIMLISNVVLFILAFTIIGPGFGGYTIYTSLALSALIYIFELVIPINTPIIDDLMLNLIYGILIQGIGMAMILNEGTSSGGTDIIAKIINKFTNLEIGKSLFLADALIALSAAFIFGLELGLYALFGILINSFVIDSVIAGFNTKIEVAIISNKEKEVSKFITNELKRGVTLLYGVGGFSNSEKRIINTVVSRREYIKIKNHLKEIDPNAFIWVSFVHEVLGEGFSY